MEKEDLRSFNVFVRAFRARLKRSFRDVYSEWGLILKAL